MSKVEQSTKFIENIREKVSIESKKVEVCDKMLFNSEKKFEDVKADRSVAYQLFKT